MPSKNIASLEFFPKLNSANQPFVVSPNAIFILGLASHGNVGQIAVDSLLALSSSFGLLTSIGSLESNSLLAISGYESFSENPSEKFLCMPLEVYMISSDLPIFVILQRSQCLPFENEAFGNILYDQLLSWQAKLALVITGASFENIEILRSDRKFCHYGNTHDLEKLNSIFPVLGNYFTSISSLEFQNVGNVDDASQPHDMDIDAFQNSLVENEEYYSEFSSFKGPPYGMFITKTMIMHSMRCSSSSSNSPEDPIQKISSLSLNDINMTSSVEEEEEEGRKLQLLVLGKYVGEGDNYCDGLELASLVAHGIGLSNRPLAFNEMKKPLSWDFKYSSIHEETNMFL